MSHGCRTLAQGTSIQVPTWARLSTAKQTNKQLGAALVMRSSANSFSPWFIPCRFGLPSMAPPKWSTPEQLAFLVKEDAQWATIKAGNSTLKSFYARTTNSFLEQWPVTPDEKTLVKVGGNAVKAQELAENKLLNVSMRLSPSTFSHLVRQRITEWFTNRHRQTKAAPSAPEPVLDLSGKHSRKRPPLQKWQAFSALYYRPQDSTIRDEVKSLFKRRNDPAVVGFLADFLPSGTNISTTDHLTFLSAYARERCTRLSSEEEEDIQAYIEEQQLLAKEHQDRPWYFDNDFEDKPLLAENRHVQQ
jgi:hypothetical protein